MTTFEAITAFYQTRAHEAFIFSDDIRSADDLETAAEAARLAAEAVGRCVPETRQEAAALLNLLVELVRAGCWEGPQAGIRAALAGTVAEAT